jgi:hypothetical protein
MASSAASSTRTFCSDCSIPRLSSSHVSQSCLDQPTLQSLRSDLWWLCPAKLPHDQRTDGAQSSNGIWYKLPRRFQATRSNASTPTRPEHGPQEQRLRQQHELQLVDCLLIIPRWDSLRHARPVRYWALQRILQPPQASVICVDLLALLCFLSFSAT